jgi:prolyl-tRNA synthetase
MKDMYSLARTQQEHDELYEKAAKVYTKVYERLGLGDTTYRTYADGGIFTNKFSDEYQTLSEVGEDTIYVDEAKKIAVNEEIYTDENLAKVGLKKEVLVQKKAVEVGNIFPLETKYTDALDVYYTDEHGEKQSIIMGCYGIGISRLMGVIAEHFADDRGLVWPINIAPAHVYLARLGEDDDVVKAADELYEDLQNAGIQVLYDDRDVRAGEKFADADLIGLPYRMVVSSKTLAAKQVELKKRTSQEVTLLAPQEAVKEIAKSLKANQ